jgi:hypothetical protein
MRLELWVVRSNPATVLGGTFLKKKDDGRQYYDFKHFFAKNCIKNRQL